MGKGEGKNRFKVLESDEDVVEQLGVKPDVIPDLFGLIGDKSDGIPGVRKVGEKKAVPMLAKYKNLEGIYENIDKLTELPGIGKGLIKNIEEDRELAFLSRDLATIHTDVHVDVSTEKFTFEMNSEKTLDLFSKLEFKSLIKKFGLEQEEEERTEEKEEIKREFAVLSDETDDIFEELKAGSRAAVFYNGVGFAISNDKKSWYLPIFHKYLGAKISVHGLCSKCLGLGYRVYIFQV